jgi:uncharacterized hydrophobic protein (TIGR00271 family)
MLHLRLIASRDRAATFEQALARTEGVLGLTSVPMSGGQGVVLEADVGEGSADLLVAALERLGVRPEELVLTRPAAITTFGSSHRDGAFAWVEVLGEARANARPLVRYQVLMAVAGVIAALGVITVNSVLIVGAMAVSPDLLPLCSICVGLVGRRPRLIRRASMTLVIGLVWAGVVATVLTLLLLWLGILPADFHPSHSAVGDLSRTDYSTVLIALAAGVAAILSFETRASAAVGVAISVTTIPAIAYFGVALAAGEAGGAGGALLVLAVNVCLLVLSGTSTLLAQRRFGRRPESPAGLA